MTQQPTFNLSGVPTAPAEPSAAQSGTGDKRPSTVVLAGAGSLLAVLAFLGGMAVGHSWDGTTNQQTQVPGGQFPRGQFPGQGNGQGNVNGRVQGTVPGQGNVQGSGNGG
jgi:hypothetical protein